jgi:hypothetical protein
VKIKKCREIIGAKKCVFFEKTGVGGLAILRTRGNPRDTTWVLLEKVIKDRGRLAHMLGGQDARAPRWAGKMPIGNAIARITAA